MRIEINNFPTHIAKTKNKVAPNKYVKLNNQSIYNSNLNRFARNIVVGNLHAYLAPYLKPHADVLRIFPRVIEVHIYTVRNHGSISRRKGNIIWKPAAEDYKPHWDIENLATIWTKVINDSLVKANVIPDDTIEYVNGVFYKYYEVEDIKDLKIVIQL